MATDAWSYLLFPASGDAWARMSGTTGDAWTRLPGPTGDAWTRLTYVVIPVDEDNLIVLVIDDTLIRTATPTENTVNVHAIHLVSRNIDQLTITKILTPNEIVRLVVPTDDDLIVELPIIEL